MRKVTIGLLALGLAALVAAPAGATVLLSEHFTYSNGNITAVSSGNWTTHSGTVSGSNDIQIISGVAEGNNANAPDDNRAFTAQTATAKTYACFTLKIPTPGTLPVVLNYFAHMKDAGTSNFAARVYVAPVAGNTGVYTVGLSVSACASPCVVATWPSNLAFGTTYIVATMYDAAAGSAKLWVNPSSEASPSISHNTFSGAGPATGVLVSSYALRQSSSGIPSGTVNWKYDVDDLGVGTTFSDACSGTTAIRTNSWGQLRNSYR